MARKAPTRRQTELALTRIAQVAPTITEGLRWASSMGYDQPTEDKPRVRTSTVSNPTRDAALSPQMQQVRRKTDDAMRHVMKAAALLEGASSALADVSRIMGDNSTAPAPYHDPSPRLVSRSELEDAEKAKARRQSRGQGWGTG